MDFYESLYKYDLEIQDKISSRINTFLQNINNSKDQIVEYRNSANNNSNFSNNINQLIYEINQSNAFKSIIKNTHKKIIKNNNKQKPINKDFIYAKDISECNESYITENNNKNNFNQKFVKQLISDKNNYNKNLISDINKIICDSIIQNVKKKFQIEINNKIFNSYDTSSNYNSFHDRCCSENPSNKIQNETDKINNITAYQYIQNTNSNNNNYMRFKKKLNINVNLRDNFTKSPINNNKLSPKSPLMRNLINITRSNIKIKTKTTKNNNSKEKNNNLSNFSRSLLRLKEYDTSNVVINNEILINNNQELNNNNNNCNNNYNLKLNRHSIKFNELKKRNKEIQIQINNKNAYTNKYQKVFPVNKNNYIDEFKNKKVFDHGQKILIKNIKLNNPINPNTNREQTQTYKNMNFKKPLLFQQIGKNNNNNNNTDNTNIIFDNPKSKRHICVSPDKININKNNNLIKLKIGSNDDLNIDIDSEISNLILIGENSERSKYKKDLFTYCKDKCNLYKNNEKNYTENSDLNNNNIQNTKCYSIRNHNKMGKATPTININLRKSHSKEVAANYEVLKNLVGNNNNNTNGIIEDKNDKEEVFKNMRAETNNELEKRKRLCSVNEKRILSGKIHIRGRENNKFMFWN